MAHLDQRGQGWRLVEATLTEREEAACQDLLRRVRAPLDLPAEPPARLTRWGRLLVWLGLQARPVGRPGRRSLGH